MRFLLRVFVTETAWYDEMFDTSDAAFAAYKRSCGNCVELYRDSENGTLLRRK